MIALLLRGRMDEANAEMTQEEFDVLDELYFVTGYDDLMNRAGVDEAVLIQTVIGLVEKGWVECYAISGEPIPESEVELPSSIKKYGYLASKEGLFAHTKG